MSLSSASGSPEPSIRSQLFPHFNGAVGGRSTILHNIWKFVETVDIAH